MERKHPAGYNGTNPRPKACEFGKKEHYFLTFENKYGKSSGPPVSQTTTPE
jgi:hypothetical protein